MNVKIEGDALNRVIAENINRSCIIVLNPEQSPEEPSALLIYIREDVAKSGGEIIINAQMKRLMTSLGIPNAEENNDVGYLMFDNNVEINGDENLRKLADIGLDFAGKELFMSRAAKVSQSTPPQPGR